MCTFLRFDNAIYSLAISPNGRILASGDNQGIIKLWDLKSRKFIKHLKAHSQIITDLVFTPDGQGLISSSEDKTIKIWDIVNSQQVATFKGHNYSVKAIAIHPEGRILVSGARDGIKLWDLSTGELLTTPDINNSKISGWEQPITDIVFSVDGKMLATGGVNRNINIWKY